MADNYVSVIIPCRNEGKFIGKCLDSIVAQDYPRDRLEVFVVDGSSQDSTREIVNDYSLKYSFIKLLENPQKYTPYALNIGIKASKGDFIVRMDAHADYNADYISKCIRYMKEYGADNIGGVLKTEPATDTLPAKAIAAVLSNPFGTGGAHFRTFKEGVTSPKEVDSVFCGCYKREVFDKIGLFNENLIRSQDFEFNLRLRENGGKILMIPDVVVLYYPSSTISEFMRHCFADGVWSVFPLKFTRRIFKLRHYLPSFFVLSLLLSALLGFFFFWPRLLFDLIFLCYLIVLGCFSLGIAIKEKDVKLVPWLIFAFLCRHLVYGLGSLWGGY